MLGYQSERQLQQLFSDLARLEHNSEDLRLRLARIYDFNPRNAFQRIDRYRNYALDDFEIKDFLREHGKFVSNSEVNLLIQQHDRSGDKRLNNREFESMVLPQTDRSAAEHSFARREIYVGRYDHLPRDIESTLADLMFNEIQALRRLEEDKDRLKRRYDFSRYEAFKSLDKYNSGSVLRADLIEFVKKAGGWATYIDADACFRRLDLDQDGRLNYSELCDFLDARPAPLGSSSPSRNSSPLRSSQTEQNDWRSKSVAPSRPMTSSIYGSPLRQTLETKKQNQDDSANLGASADKSTAYGSPSPNKAQELSPEKELQPRKLDMDELEEASPEKEQSAQEEKQEEEAPKSEVKEEVEEESKAEPKQEEEEAAAEEKPAEVEKPIEKPRYKPAALNRTEEFDLFWSLKRMIELENEAERAKQDLALRYDFNLFDAFRTMDKAGQSEIFRFEFSDVLRQHGVYSDRAEIELAYRKFDRNKDGKLRFSEFSDLIAPLDRMSADALNRRQSNHRDPRPFSSLTMQMFEDTLRKILRTFGSENDMNRRLREKPAFFISGAFERIDVDGNGFISKAELQRFFDEHRHFATSRELDLLINRFDSNKDGRITYSEFFDGLSAV